MSPGCYCFCCYFSIVFGQDPGCLFSSIHVFDVGVLDQAYAWGFDIRSWQRHLNPLTWPEILRQFALSAGFGPRLKKRNVEEAYLRDDNEVRTISFFFYVKENSIMLYFLNAISAYLLSLCCAYLIGSLCNV